MVSPTETTYCPLHTLQHDYYYYYYHWHFRVAHWRIVQQHFYLDGGGGSNKFLRRMFVVIVVVVWRFEWPLVDREDRGNDPNEKEI